MEIPPGNTMENSGKWNPESGFKSPPEQRRKSRAPQIATLLIDFCAIFDPILTSILGAQFGISADSWARTGA
jgi:hypothetical protein